MSESHAGTSRYLNLGCGRQARLGKEEVVADAVKGCRNESAKPLKS